MLDQLAVVDSQSEENLNRTLALQYSSIPVNVVMVLRHLSDRIEDLEKRIAEQEA